MGSVKEREDALSATILARNHELTVLAGKLTEAQNRLIQSEKMASLGQLAAGVAHEINNPIAYVRSNVNTLAGYLQDLLRIIDRCAAADRRPLRQSDMDEIGFLREDIPALLRECQEGLERVGKIVRDLKDFSRAEAAHEWEWADIEQGIDSTLNIVAHEIKYRADVVKKYAGVPPIKCLPFQLNQVFMNLLVNAAHAIEGERGTITITTSCSDTWVRVEIHDNGKGIPPEIIDKIFDPFFTTKPQGKGTGLGLSLSYGIVKSHGGSISVTSSPGSGTTFSIQLPREPHPDRP